MGVTCKICPDIANNTAYTVLDATVRGQINSDTFSIKSNFSLSFLIWLLGIHSKELAIFFLQKNFFLVLPMLTTKMLDILCAWRIESIPWPDLILWLELSSV